MSLIRFSVNKQKPLSYADCKIPTGKSAKGGIGADPRTHLGRVRPVEWSWDKIVEKALTEFRTDETFAQYSILKTNEFPDDWATRPSDTKPCISAFHQSGRLKAANGFLCPSLYFTDRRTSGEAYDFSLLVLDIDTPPSDLFDQLRLGTTVLDKFLFVAYTTHSATQAKPKARVIIPLENTVSAPKYEALARYLARDFDPAMLAVDRVTFRDNQLMYWPTTSADGFWDCYENPFGDRLDADSYLSQFENWEDPDNWPRLPSETIVGASTKAHPTEKRGIIGAFNRTYPIERAMDEIIPGTYEPSGVTDRFSYMHGTSGDGALLRDDGYTIQTYHGSDPVAIRSNGQASSWDMVRLHKFGGLDDDARADTAVDNLPSQKAMRAYAQTLPEVLSELDQVPLSELSDDDVVLAMPTEAPATEAQAESAAGDKYADLADILGEAKTPHGVPGVLPDFVTPDNEVDPLLPYRSARKLPAVITNWMERLTRDKEGTVEPTTANVLLILNSNSRFRGALGRMATSYMPVLTRPISISEENIPGARVLRHVAGDPLNSALTDGVYTVIKAQLQSSTDHGGYGMRTLSSAVVKEAVDLCIEANPVKPVRDWLIAQKGADHEPMEHERALSKIFQMEDTPYSRWVSRRFFRAIVERILEPGHIEEDVPILIGPQEVGKTTFIRNMIPIAGAVMTYTGDIADSKLLMEAVRDSVVVELGELTALKRSEVEAVKAAISKTIHTYRPAFGRMSLNVPVGFVFYGNSNTHEVLVDRTGNRRFNPIEITGRGMSVEELIAYAPSVWAAALSDYVEARKAKPRRWFAGPDGMVRSEDCLTLPMPKSVKVEAENIREEATILPEDQLAEPIARLMSRPVRLGSISIGLDKADQDRMVMRESFLVSSIAEELKIDPQRNSFTIIAALRDAGFVKSRVNGGRPCILGIRGRWYVRAGAERDADFSGYRIATEDEMQEDEI